MEKFHSWKNPGLLADPSMAVRADIVGRYGHRLYAYDPDDIELCKYKDNNNKKQAQTEL